MRIVVLYKNSLNGVWLGTEDTYMYSQHSGGFVEGNGRAGSEELGPGWGNNNMGVRVKRKTKYKYV